MAQRRMFSKTITNSSQFLMMPNSSQNLYFHLGMNADDDGFCEHFAIMRMTDSKPDDLKVLAAKGFVNVFNDKVLVIIDWKENNYLRSDRYTPSKYLSLFNKELLSFGIPNGNQMATQVRLGKVRLGKDNKDTGSSEDSPAVFSDHVKQQRTVFKKPTIKDIQEYCKERGNSISPAAFYDHYESKGWVVGKTKMKDWKAAVRTWEHRNGEDKCSIRHSL